MLKLFFTIFCSLLYIFSSLPLFALNNDNYLPRLKIKSLSDYSEVLGYSSYFLIASNQELNSTYKSCIKKLGNSFKVIPKHLSDNFEEKQTVTPIFDPCHIEKSNRLIFIADQLEKINLKINKKASAKTISVLSHILSNHCKMIDQNTFGIQSGPLIEKLFEEKSNTSQIKTNNFNNINLYAYYLTFKDHDFFKESYGDNLNQVDLDDTPSKFDFFDTIGEDITSPQNISKVSEFYNLIKNSKTIIRCGSILKQI